LLCRVLHEPAGFPGRGDNRPIFDIGGNRHRLIVHVSCTYKRVLVKFVGTHAECDRIDPEAV
jgi:mRNA interferase HigB